MGPVTPSARLQVLVAGADRERRSSLRERVRACDGVGVCWEARDGPAALRIARAERPDLCLVAVEAGFDSDDVVHALRRHTPEMRIVLAGPEPDDEALLNAVAAGAFGWIAPDLDAERLAAVLLEAASGLPVFPQRLALLLIRRMRDESRGGRRGSDADAHPRREVLELGDRRRRPLER